MGKKGGSKHLKRKPAPKFWPIHRKEFLWTVKPKPGPHPVSHCLPLMLITREILGLAKTRNEAKKIISQEKIEVDGKTRREARFPVGLMDVVSIPDIKELYRILPSAKGLTLHPITKEEMTFKLCRIEDKTIVKRGYTQLNLHDGRNILVQVTDPNNPEEDIYQTLDTLKISLPSQEIVEQIKLDEGAHALIIGGKNMGSHGKIVAIEKKTGREYRNSLVTIEDINGDRLQTIIDYIFVVGNPQPVISLPEVS